MADVKEGFLCPICMTDLRDEIQLTVHFNEKHAAEDPAIVRSLKDMLGKAKKKITNKDVDNGVNDINLESEMAKEMEKFYGTEPLDHHPVSGIHTDLKLTTKNTIDLVDHMDTYRMERAKRADIRAMDVNKLIVRLEKLLCQLPSDPVKRRAHEQAVCEMAF